MRCCREQPSSHLRKDFWLLVSDHPPLWPPATQMSDTESTYEDSNYDTPSSDSGGVGGAKRHTGDADPRVPPRVALRVMAAEAAIVANATATSKKTGQPLANTGGRAGELLREAIDGLPPTKRAEMLALLPPQREQPKFCKDQLTHLRVHGTCWDAPRPGRPPKALSEAELAKGVKAVVKACPAKVDDMVKLPYFRCIWRRKSIGHRGVLRQLCKYEPRLGKRLLVEYKQPLTPKLMRQRVATTKDWLEKAVIPEEPSPSLHSNPRPARKRIPSAGPLLPKSELMLNKKYLRRIIWVDAKKFWVKTASYKRWGLRGTPSIVQHDPRVRAAMSINYYSAVNYAHGGLLIKLVTGTKGPGYKPRREFMVSCTRG